MRKIFCNKICQQWYRAVTMVRDCPESQAEAECTEVRSDLGNVEALNQRIQKFIIGCFVFAWPFAAIAQQTSTCSSPTFEERLIAAIVKGEAQLKSIPAGKAQDYARCYARTACAALSKIEFEMYALSQITSYFANDRVEVEYLSRMRQHRKENNSGLDKLPPNQLEATCKREIGMK
jgi:hypothetical protein